MKKRLLVLLLTTTMVFTMLALSGCGGQEEPEDAAETGETITFVQGFDKSYAPFSSVDEDGNAIGFDVELCQALCEELGWNYEAKPIDWSERDEVLTAGDCDCLWSAVSIEGKEENYTFSVPYGTVSTVIIVKKDSGISSLDDLAGKMVAVTDQTDEFDNLNSGVAADLAKTFGSLIVEATSEICFEDLERGAVDAIVVEDAIGDYLIGDKSDEYEYMSENLGWATYAVAFRKDDTDLASKVSDGLKKLAENGKFDEIAAKYPEIKPYLTVQVNE